MLIGEGQPVSLKPLLATIAIDFQTMMTDIGLRRPSELSGTICAVDWLEVDREYQGLARMEEPSWFIAELRRMRGRRGLEFWEGLSAAKGGHAMIWVGDKVTTLPAREIDPRRRGQSSKARSFRIAVTDALSLTLEKVQWQELSVIISCS